VAINAAWMALNPKDQAPSIKISPPRTTQKPTDQAANQLSDARLGPPEISCTSTSRADPIKIPAATSLQTTPARSRS
ncbi:uncharacterized protein METZ01_LOCUS16965, partial [marine metagenome]